MKKNIQFQKLLPKNSIIRQIIKYFWMIQSDSEIKLNRLFFPTLDQTVIMNFTDNQPFNQANGKNVPKMSFSGIWNKPKISCQKGKVDMIGFCFVPGAASRLLGIPLSECSHNTLDMDLLIKDFTCRIEEELYHIESPEGKIETIEDLLLQMLKPNYMEDEVIFHSLHRFKEEDGKNNIAQYCDEYGVHPRTLQRYFNKHLGRTPKEVVRVIRFNNAMNGLLYGNYEDLALLAAECGFYDQAHFNNDFKIFTGKTPTDFLNNQKSLLGTSAALRGNSITTDTDYFKSNSQPLLMFQSCNTNKKKPRLFFGYSR